MLRLIILVIFSLLRLSSSQFVPVETESVDNSQNPILSFGVLTDVQYCIGEPDGSRHYARSLIKLNEAVNSFNSEEVDFIVNIGDLIDRDINSYKSVLPLLNKSKAPVYNVLGNHDFSVDRRERAGIMKLLAVGEGYYSFTLETFRFIILNSNDLSLYSPQTKSRNAASKLLEKLKADEAINAYEWNGTIGEKQKNWLISQLDEAAKQNQKVILFSHHPVWPESEYCMLNYESLLKITEAYSNIGAWFSGHDHGGSYGNYNLIHFVSFKGMVETEELNSYAVVELYNNKIWIKGYGREKGQILAW